MLSYSRSPPKPPDTSSHSLVYLVLTYPNMLFQKCESIFLLCALRYQIDLSAASHCSSTGYCDDKTSYTEDQYGAGEELYWYGTQNYTDMEHRIILTWNTELYWHGTQNYTDMEHRITLRQFLPSPLFLPLSAEKDREQRQSRAEFYSILPSGFGDYISTC